MVIPRNIKPQPRRQLPFIPDRPPLRPPVKELITVPDSKLIGIFAPGGDEDKALVRYLGPEMIDQLNWYYAAFWTTLFEIAWSEGANSLVCDGSSGLVGRSNFWIAGVIYQITFSGNRTSGTLFGPYDGSGTAGALSSDGSVTYDYSPEGDVMYIYGSGFFGDLTFLSVRKILYKEVDE